MTRRLQKSISIGITTLFVAFGAAMLALLLPTGWKLFSVQSGSMEPALSTGDLVLVHSVPAPEYRVGDVITYTDPDNPKQTITHRISDIRDGGSQRVFVTQGDANARADRPFNQAMVVGRQEVAVPYLGHAIDFIFTLPGLLLVIWLPALWIIAGETKQLAAYYRRFKPYQAYEPRPQQSYPPVAAVVGGVMALTIAGVAVPAFAAISPAASMTGNVIALRGAPVTPEPPVTEPHVSCKNKADVKFRQRTRQQARSGSASSHGNTSNGAATSGDVSNTSSTNFNVDVNNDCSRESHSP